MTGASPENGERPTTRRVPQRRRRAGCRCQRRGLPVRPASRRRAARRGRRSRSSACSTGSAPQPPVALVAIRLSRSSLVSPVARALQATLGASDPSKVKIATSAHLIAVRDVVSGQLGSFSRGLVAVVFAITWLLLVAIPYGLVALRRKDFGRRRAHGTTRGLIVALLLVQMAMGFITPLASMLVSRHMHNRRAPAALECPLATLAICNPLAFPYATLPWVTRASPQQRGLAKFLNPPRWPFGVRTAQERASDPPLFAAALRLLAPWSMDSR